MFYGSRWNVIYLNKQFCSTNTWAHIEELALFLLCYEQYLTEDPYSPLFNFARSWEQAKQKRASIYEG